MWVVRSFSHPSSSHVTSSYSSFLAQDMVPAKADCILEMSPLAIAVSTVTSMEVRFWVLVVVLPVNLSQRALYGYI